MRREIAVKVDTATFALLKSFSIRNVGTISDEEIFTLSRSFYSDQTF